MIKLTLPVYLYINKSTVLYSSNWARNAHFHFLNKAKKHYHELVASRLTEFEPIKGKFACRYTYYYKNSASDAPNVVSQIEKALLDSMQIIGLVENDNVKFHTHASWRVGGQDKENPRMEIEIYEISSSI